MQQAESPNSTTVDARAINLSAQVVEAHLAYLRLAAPWFGSAPSQIPTGIGERADAALRRHGVLMGELAPLRVTSRAAMEAKARAIGTDLPGGDWRRRQDPAIVAALTLALDLLGMADFPDEAEYIEQALASAA